MLLCRLSWVLIGILLQAESDTTQDAVRRVHDPVIIRQNDTYYVFSSGVGVPVRRSKDLVHWEQAGRVFAENAPAWGKAEVPGARDVWAPDISFYNGKYHLYYAVSTMGSQRSCIGVATNVTLDPSSPKFRWEDQGKVLETFPGKMDHNAIDANLVLDDKGEPWLVWGSFWGGIKLTRLDAKTGMRSTTDQKIYSLAARPVEKSIEGAFLVRKNGWYYLFASFDHCCRGVASNYKVMVGRSREITGPYVDFHGKPMMEGNATLVLAGYGDWRGPGHNGILLDANGDWMVHHMYDVSEKGMHKMQVRPLIWGKDGWPLVGEPVKSSPESRSAVTSAGLEDIWRISINFGADEYIVLRSGGKIRSAMDDATWSLQGKELELRWPHKDAPNGAWIDTCVVADDGKSFVGRNQKGDVIRGSR